MKNLTEKEKVLRDGFASAEDQGYVPYLNEQEKLDFFQTKMVGYAEDRNVALTKEEARSYAQSQLDLTHKHADLMTRYYVKSKGLDEEKKEAILASLYSVADVQGFVQFFTRKERTDYLVHKMMEMAQEQGISIQKEEIENFVLRELGALQKVVDQNKMKW